MSGPDDLIDARAVSELLGIPIGTIHAMVCRRQIPHFKISPRITRFSRAEIFAWLEEKRVTMAPADEIAKLREARAIARKLKRGGGGR